MIAFDLDDVIANTSPILIRGFARTLGMNVPKDRPQFKITIPGYDDATIGAFINKFLYEGTLSGELDAEAHAVDALSRIHEMTKTPIYIVTARDERQLGAVTRKWVSDTMKKIPHELHFTNGASKVPFIPPGCRFFVDDKPENIYELSRYMEMVFAVRKKYNEHMSKIPNVVRITGLQSVADIIDYKINADAIAVNQRRGQ